MMAKPVKGKTTFGAYAYRPTRRVRRAAGPATIPGPLIEAEVGDTIVVHFRNKLKTPVTIHPHGIFYSNEMDGAYKGKFTDPGGFVQRNRTFTYVWEASEGTQGTWLYHDHGPMDPLPLFKGLFGPLIDPRAGRSRGPTASTSSPSTPGPADDRAEGQLLLHQRPGLCRQHADLRSEGRRAGRLPRLRGRQLLPHLPPARPPLAGPDGTIIDNRTFGPADSFRLEFTEDNPGRWFYHCHVFQHLHEGMNGWYLVS